MCLAHRPRIPRYVRHVQETTACNKSCLDAFSERQNDAVSAILISSSLSSLTEQIANSLNKLSSVIVVLTLFFQALAFLIPAIHLDPEDISSPYPN